MRGERRDSHSSAASATSAAGISQLTWPPISAPNSRVRLAGPPNCGPVPFPNPTEPASFPSSLPNPL